MVSVCASIKLITIMLYHNNELCVVCKGSSLLISYNIVIAVNIHKTHHVLYKLQKVFVYMRTGFELCTNWYDSP